MKLKAGQLATVTFGNISAACIVLEHMQEESTPIVWYKVYMIELQRTTYFREHILSPINPQEAENEV